MPSANIKKLIFNRDGGVCWHCGIEETTIHHRQNRQAGGDRTKQKVADRPSNLLTICPQFNSQMESELQVIRIARDRGWKLRRGELSTHTPVYRYDGTWWILTDMGTMFQVDDDSIN